MRINLREKGENSYELLWWEDMDITNGVMEELKEVNAALNILDENGINYDNMLYISNHIG